MMSDPALRLKAEAMKGAKTADGGKVFVSGWRADALDVIDALDRLRAEHAELVEALKVAVQCVEYCRRAHKDVQSGSGVPVEAIWKGMLARIAER